MMEGGRNLAIECGKACHDYCACAADADTAEVGLATDTHSLKLFGKERWESML